MNHDSQLPAPGRLTRLGVPYVAPPDRLARAGMLRSQLLHQLGAFRKRWWLPWFFLVVIGGPAVLYSLKSPRLYRSQATLWLGGRLELPEGRIYSEELSSYLGTQAELIKSPLIKNRAIEKVRALYPEAVPDERAIDLAARNSLRSSTLEIVATGASPEATRLFVDTLVEEYLNFKNESRTKTSATALSGITDQITALEKQIRQKQNEMTAFETTNNISFLTESGTGAGSHLSRLNGLLSELQTERRLLELLTPGQLQGIATPPRGTSTGVSVPGQQAAQDLVANSTAGQASYYQALQQVELLKAKRDDFAKVLRPAHSKMVKMNQEIGALEQLLATLKRQGEQEAFAQLTNRKKALDLQIQGVEAQCRAWETNAIEASRKLAQHDRLKQELERSNALYDRLLGLVQTVDLTKSLERESLTRVGPASPARPTLSKYKIGAAGVFAGLLVGFGFLLVLSALDDRFTSAAELSLHVPAEVVGQIPESRHIRHAGRRRLLANPRDEPAFAESFRSLRSYLLCMSELPPGSRTILITSAVPKEGKTTVSANLAKTLAMAGERVLLIDADVRRSALHKIFGVKAAPGLCEVLNRKIAAADAIHATTLPSLFFMAAGQAETGVAELFASQTVGTVLGDAGKQYDYVIIDTAPVLATDDAGSLGRVVHGAFVVVRAAHTSARMVREALDRLHRGKVTLLGLVYNRAPQSSDYYCRYSREYGAGNNGSILLRAYGTEGNRTDAEAETGVN